MTIAPSPQIHVGFLNVMPRDGVPGGHTIHVGCALTVARVFGDRRG
jgi:hypothetical protein